MFNFFSTLLLAIALSPAFAQSKGENIRVYWPSNFKILDLVFKSKTITEYLIPKQDSRKKWTLLGSTVTNKKTVLPYNDSIWINYKVAIAQHSADAVITLLEKDTSTKTYWYIYKVQGIFNQKALRQESSLFYVMQGKHNLFEVSITVNDRTFPDGFIENWIKVFKKTEIYYDF
jgi:hypothetical protein